MKNETFYEICIALVLIYSLLYLFIRRDWIKKWNPLAVKMKRVKTSEALATNGLNKIESWTKWMAGIQTTAIAFMGYLLAEAKCSIEGSATVGFLSLLFFGASILLCSWLMGGIPSVQIRLKQSATKKNDVFEMRVFEFLRLRMGTIFGLIHQYFVIGIFFFSLFTILMLRDFKE